MDADRYRRAKQLMLAALDLEAERREGFLRAECGTDDDLLAEVRELLD